MKRTALFVFRVVLIGVMVAGCGGNPTPLPSPQPTSRSTPEKTPVPLPTPTLNEAASLLKNAPPLPPLVLPANGSGMIPRDGVVEVSFSQPMDAASTSANFTLNDSSGMPVTGSIDWPSPTRLRFSPQQPLHSGTSYQAVINEGAKDAQGVVLEEAVKLDYQVTGAIRVGQVFPANGTQDVANDSALTVLFDRPVVPLRIAEEQQKLPNPLQIDPPIQGKGEWVNTSVYVFRPESVFKSSTTYTITIPAGMADLTGGGSDPLQEDYQWSFTTMSPAVKDLVVMPFGDEKEKFSLTEQNYYADAPLDVVFQLSFLQPMEREATSAAISLVQMNDSGGAVALEQTWSDDNQQVQIKPSAQLTLGGHYAFRIASSAQAADGGTMENDSVWSIDTVSPPKVISTVPSEGSQSADPWFEIDFASPMKIQTIIDHLTFNPPLENTSGSENWYYDPYRYVLYQYGLASSTAYTVTLSPGMEDLYGNSIQDGQVIHFKTRALDPYAWIAAPDKPLWRSGTPGDFYLNVANVDQIKVMLYRLSFEDIARLESFNSGGGIYQFNPSGDTLVWQTVLTPNLPKNQANLLKVRVNPEQETAPGFYMLAVDVPGISHPYQPYQDVRLVMVSGANLTAKVSQRDALMWLTDLASGKPIADAPVEIFDAMDYSSLGGGRTDSNGLLKIDLPREVTNGIVAMSGEPGGSSFAYSATYWGSGVWPGEFGIGQSYYTPFQSQVAYVYTERPIYRPGQTVYFKGILRQDDDLNYSLPDQSSIEVVINSFDKEVYREKLAISGTGTFNGEFPLDSEAALGSYYLKLVVDGNEDNPIGGIAFNVAEYRRPEFQVSVDVAQANVLAGESFSANLKAEYYSGGGVANASVYWSLRSQSFTFTPPPDFARYNFNDYDWDVMDYFSGSHQQENDNLLAEGSGQTDDNGLLTLTIPADIQKDASQTLVLEATITDLAGAAVSGRAEVVAHRSMVYPGLRFGEYIGQVGKEQQINLAALDWEGNPLANQKVTVEVVERRWHSVQEQNPNGQVQWSSSVEEIPVKTFNDVSLGPDGKGSVIFTPPNGGVFKAKVLAQDSKGKTGSASAYIWVTGENYIAWRQGNDRSFQLIVDQDNYRPGDTAQILIASPFQGTNYALVTVERGKIRQQQVILLENNSTIYSLPITPDLAPNAYVSVMVVKGVDATNPYPDFRVGMAEIKVATDQQVLNVAVTPDTTSAGPGDNVTYQVQVSDQAGKPVQAEVSLGLSDLATLSLAAPNSQPIVDGFYNRRSLSVITGVSMINSLEAANASLAKSARDEGRGQGSGGGKGEGEMGVFEVRQDFPDTAFWKADVQTDANGQASVTVKLPDNLTIWRMDARAVTTDTRVGQTIQDLRSTKPLLVRPQTPRFFVAGDVVTVGTAVHNNSDQNLSVEVGLEVVNLDLKSQGTQTVKIEAGKQAFVSWQVSVPENVSSVQLTFSAKGGPFMDASRPTIGTAGLDGLPVFRYEAPETVSTSGQMSEGGSRAEAIMLPEEWDVTQGQLDISVSPSLSASLTDGLTYLEHYPYECTEQTVSRFLPNVVIARVLRDAGVQDPELEAGLKDQVNLALQRLASGQNSDGGWGYWKPGDSNDLVTAYAVLGLIEARNSGFDVPDQMYDDGVTYLTYHSSFSNRWLDQAAVDNRSAFILYVLARADVKKSDQINSLYDRRVNLQLYARAFLTQAMWLVDPKDPRLDTLRSDLNNAAVLSASGTHWNEATADRWNWSTDTRTTAIILDALVQMDAQNPINANAVRWLMSHRTGGHWDGTQETAWTLLALADWMSHSNDLKASYSFAVGINDNTVSQGEASQDTLRQTWSTTVEVKDLLKDAANKLVFARTAGQGNLYYTANLNVYLPVKDVLALNQGVIISRTYTRADAPDTPINSAEQGELLRVRLTITSPAGLHYLLVNDPLPAGFEAVDTSLLTSPQGEEPQQYSWSDWESEGWGWWYFNHAEFRDEAVVLSSDYLPAGTYVYTYLVRASTKGTFNVIPPTAQEFYFPEVYGRGDGMQFEVK